MSVCHLHQLNSADHFDKVVALVDLIDLLIGDSAKNVDRPCLQISAVEFGGILWLAK